MPSIYVPLPLPVVPAVPGVPPLPGGITVALPALVSGDASALFGAVAHQQWGIFTQGGSPVFTVDSVGAIEFAQDYRISDYPQEQGGFQSYNKVALPFQGKVTFLVNRNRAGLLNQLPTQLASLSLLSLVTPEVTYPSCNVIHQGYRRTSRNGVTLIAVDVWVEEVRVTATATSTGAATAGTGAGASAGGGIGSDTGSVNGTPTSDDGTVQPQLTPGITAPSGASSPATVDTLPPDPSVYGTGGGTTVPSTWGMIDLPGQQTAVAIGISAGASGAIVSPPTEDGTIIWAPGM